MSIACSEGPEPEPEPTPQPQPTIAVSSITLDSTSATMLVGETLTLKAKVLPENATNQTISWSSSDSNIATVDNGKITAIAVGSATITAQIGEVKAECEVTVKPIDATAITLNKSAIELLIDETFELTATITPDDVTDKTITWSSSNSNIATVDNGKITAIAVGSATITAQIGEVKAECEVTVKPIEATAITLNKSAIELLIDETFELTATITPDDVTDKTITWSSSDSNIATVDNGKITAIAVGSATITAQIGEVKAECEVTVKSIEVTSITLNKTAITLSIGETFELIATITPDDASNKTVTWSSSNTNVATITDGKVTALAIGKTVITAQSNNGLNSTCSITVVDKPVPGGSEGTKDEEW